MSREDFVPGFKITKGDFAQVTILLRNFPAILEVSSCCQVRRHTTKTRKGDLQV